MGEATLRLSRVWSGVGIGGQSSPWDLVVDGKVVGSIANQETVEIAVTPGRHTLRIGRGRHISKQLTLDVGEDEVATFRCHGPRFWPQLVAAAIKPDLWITLQRG